MRYVGRYLRLKEKPKSDQGFKSMLLLVDLFKIEDREESK